MTNNNNTNTTNTNTNLLTIVKNNMHDFDALSVNPDAKNIDLVTARDALEQAVMAYNRQTLEAAYADFDKADAPLKTLAIRATWDKLTTRRKDGVTAIVFRATRFSVPDYLQHVVDARKDGANINLPASIDTIKEALKKASEALSAYVLFSINHDTEGVSTKNTAAAIYSYARLFNVDSLRVRPADVRYLAMVVTRAGELGEVRTIKPESVARYLLDVVHIHATGKEYKLESAKKVENK